jgi:copper resistance protein D
VESGVTDPMIYVRAVHFAATIMAAGVVFFIVFVAAPALRKTDDKPDDKRVRAALLPQLAFIAWFSLVLAVGSGAVWLVLTAASMSGQPPADVLSGGVVWTVLSQTHFGWDWTARLILACLLAGTYMPLLSARDRAVWLDTAAIVLAACLIGTLAWAGHAAGGEGVEAIVHPAADFLHLVAAAAWLGALIPLALLLGGAGEDGSLAVARAATLRFSTLGLVSVGTLLVTGSINTWYLAGSIPALVGTDYGRLLLAKIALFFVMVAIAAVNRLRFTPRLVQDQRATAAQDARRQLRRNAVIETLLGAAIICIVAVLGTEPPGSHANHHPVYGAIPDDAAFVHIHTEQAMADVMIRPGRPGAARATIHLWNEDSEPLDVREMKFSVTPPAGGSASPPRLAVQDADGAWLVDGIELSQPGNWTVTVDAALKPSGTIVLSAPIVIDPAP